MNITTVQPDGLAVGEAVTGGLGAVVAVWVGLAVAVTVVLEEGAGVADGLGVTVGRGLSLAGFDGAA
ncbi:MAG TPA: hypothetical protein VLJ88_11205 [Propionibacteriaceae bacterium]|nr:hypothetical protein [Propionibacteriaceae bacterium]